MLVARVKFKTKLGDFFLLAKLAISLQEKQEEGVVGRFLHFFGRPKLDRSAQRSSPTGNGFSKFWGH